MEPSAAKYSLHTTRPSAVIRRLLTAYSRDVAIIIDGKRFADADVPHLLSEWCTNRNIRAAINFEIVHKGRAVFGFHDSIDDLWYASSEEAFVELLAREKLLRIRRLPQEQTKGVRGCLPRSSILQVLSRWLRNRGQ